MYNFRLHFVLAKSSTIGIDRYQWLFMDDNHEMVLQSLQPNRKIIESKDLTLTGKNYSSEIEARIAGTHFRDAIIATLVHFKQGADFGDDKAKGGFSCFLTDLWKKRFGLRNINDLIGLMVYEDDPNITFSYFSRPAGGLLNNEKDFVSFLSERLRNVKLSIPRQRLAIRLFFDSFFESSPETRFLLLVMSIEALLEPKERSKETRKLVNRFICNLNLALIPEQEKASLRTSLNYLLKESISKSGKDLVQHYLGDKKYMNMKPDAFFTHCYSLRSNLVHGNKPSASREDLGNVAAQLELFVSQLLDAIIQESTMIP